MSKLKNFLCILVIFLVIGYVCFNRKQIATTIHEKLEKPKAIIKEGNQYTKGKDYKFVQQATDFIPHNYQDLINIYYTSIDKGWEEFTFYCDREYTDCIKDVETISNDKVLLSNINNYVHPYNSYSEIKTIYDDTGEVTLKISHQYNQEEIVSLEYKIDDLFNATVNNQMDNLTKIRKIHDYIVNNTIYDVNRIKYEDTTHDSTRMNGILMEGYGICSAYSDLMATVFFRLNIDNFKISSSKHVWNVLFIDDNWLHLDATWDDPVTNTGTQLLTHDYYLITTKELKEKTAGDSEHQFDNKYYLYFGNEENINNEETSQ